MKNRKAKIGLALFVCFVVGQLIVVTSYTETGWGFLGTLWQNSCLVWLGLDHTFIDDMSPAEQADYWLVETDRILQLYPDSASIHMGAAWVLDSPTVESWQGYGSQRSYAKYLLGKADNPFDMPMDLEQEKARFRVKCQKRSLELAARATELEPTSKRWWRMRALLLFEDEFWWGDQKGSKGDSDRIQVLDECKLHDPDNALYDYLAALQLWKQSAEYDSKYSVHENKHETYYLTVNDESTFKLGRERFLLGQERDYLSLGEGVNASVTDLLEKSNLRKVDQASVAFSWNREYRHQNYYGILREWQKVYEDVARQAGNDQGVITSFKQYLRIVDQAGAVSENSGLRINVSALHYYRRYVFDKLEDYIKDNQQLIDVGELERLRLRERELRIETATLELALQKLYDGKYPSQPSLSLPLVIVLLASTSFMALVLIAAVLWAFSKCFLTSFPEPNRQRVLEQVIIWLVGVAISGFLFGVLPGGGVEKKTQGVFFLIGTSALLLILLMIVASWRIFKRVNKGQFRFRLKELFLLMTVVAIVAACRPLYQSGNEFFNSIQDEVFIEARGIGGVSSGILRRHVQDYGGPLTWIAVQWFAYGGQYVAIGLSLLVATFLYLWRRVQTSHTSLLALRIHRVRSQLSGLCHYVGRLTLLMAICWLMIYCLGAVYVVCKAEEEYQFQMMYCGNPETYWSEIKEAQQKVLADEQEMKPIYEQVDFEMSDEDVFEQDFGEE